MRETNVTGIAHLKVSQYRGSSKTFANLNHRTKYGTKYSSVCRLLFLLRAGSDTLPTPPNHKRWRLRVDAKCGLCGDCSPTVLHILNGCPVALNQSRYTWKHDSVLRKIDQSIRPQLSTDESLYTDLRGLRAQENPTSTAPSCSVSDSPSQGERARSLV